MPLLPLPSSLLSLGANILLRTLFYASKNNVLSLQGQKNLSTQTVHKVILKISLYFYIGHVKMKHSEPNASNFSRNIITIISVSFSVSGCQYHNHRQGIEQLNI